MSEKKGFKISLVGLVLILSIVVGSLSGVVASVLTDQSINSYIELLSEDAQFFSLSEVKPRPLPGSYEESLDRVQEVASPATATIRKKTEDKTRIDQWVRLGEIAGTGAVVTSDGWVLFHESALSDFDRPEAQAEIWIASERFLIEEIVEDPLTNAVMIRVDAKDLVSVAFGSTQDMDGGEILFASSGTSTVSPASLLDAQDYVEDLSLPAEEFLTFWQTDLTSTESTVLFNSSAELVAIHTQGETIPMHHALGFVDATLRDQSSSRAAIGAYTVDIASILNMDGDLVGDLKEGALIMAPETRVRAVLRVGPAMDADLEAGDIIISVDSVKVGQGVTLAEILADQDIGKSVQIEYFRDNDYREATVILADYSDLIY
jgi:serine protease Do